MYLDISVLVAALTREARTLELQHWLAAQPPDALYLSNWVVTEFSSALSIKLRAGDLTETERAEVLSVFTALTEASLGLLPIGQADFRTAAHFADHAGIGLRSGDALHLAVASAHGSTLYTLDRKLLEAAPDVAVSAREP